MSELAIISSPPVALIILISFLSPGNIFRVILREYVAANLAKKIDC
jgi:hypothetical protein